MKLFDGEMKRGAYALRTVGASIVVFISEGLSQDKWGDPTGWMFVHVPLVITTVIYVASIVVRRLHDLGRPGSHYFLAYVPIYNVYFGLVLLFMESQPLDPLVEAFQNSSGRNRRKCPYCAETIRSAAVVCRFCGRDVESKEVDRSTKAKQGTTQREPLSEPAPAVAPSRKCTTEVEAPKIYAPPVQEPVVALSFDERKRKLREDLDRLR